MVMDKPISLEEYQEVAQEFMPKYNFVLSQLPEGSKTEDVLKIMETMAGLAHKKRSEDKKSSMGFNKED